MGNIIVWGKISCFIWLLWYNFVVGIFKKLFNRKTEISINQNDMDSLVVFLECSKKVKLGSRVVIPQDFCAVVLSKEKLLDILPAGEFEFGGLTIPKACKVNKMDKPTKKGYKNELALDLYFVNLNKFKFTNSFFIKKTQYKFDALMKIIEPKKFLNFLFEEKIIFDKSFAIDELSFYISQLIYFTVLKNKSYDEEYIKDYIKQKLDKIGVEMLSILIENGKYHHKLNEGQSQESHNLDESVNFVEKKNCLIDLDDISSEKINYFVCDNCGTKLPTSSQKCFACGKKFIEENLCENCGKIIEKNVFVCPYCKAVVLQNTENKIDKNY